MNVTLDNETESKILSDISNLGVGERLTFFSNGMFSSIDILFGILSAFGGDNKIDIMISTWQLGIRDAERLTELIEDNNISLRILLDVGYKDRCPKYFDRVKMSLGDIIWFSQNHCKVMVIGSADKHFAVLSSANFNRNFRFEFFDITRSTELCSLILRNHASFFAGNPISNDENDRPTISNRFKELFDGDKREIPNLSTERSDESDTILKDLQFEFKKACLNKVEITF